MTLQQVEKALESIATNHRQINSYGHGELYDIVTSGDTNYPLMYTMLENSTIGGRVESLVFTILVMDIVKGGRVNEKEVSSDMLEITKDILAQLQHPSYDWQFDEQSVTIEPFTERFTDSVTGYSFKVTLLLPFAFDRCSMPYNTTTISADGRGYVIVYESDGVTIADFVPNNGSYILGEMNYTLLTLVSGAVDGVNTVFVFNDTPVQVVYNGNIVLNSNYTLVGNTVTLSFVPFIGESLTAYGNI